MKRLLQLVFILIFNFLSAQETTYEILNTSINSKFAELGVTYSGNNSVIFASSKKDNSRRRTNNRQLGLELYRGLIAENGDIIQTEKFTTEINNKFFQSDISFTPDFKTVFFTWNNFYNTQTRKDSAKWKTLRIFKGSINENFEISEVNPLPFNNEEYTVRSPMVSKGGKKLFFVSDMPGGYGETDIYVVDIYNTGNYGIPKNLGPTINTKLSELFPYIDENNTLYFSSNGHKGKGGLDIFKSEFKNSDYQQAINLPTPINSKDDDFAFVIKIASNSGYFTSNRDGGKGGVDIYAFKIKEPECAQSISVLALNELTERPLDQVAVSLFQNNNLIEKQTISKNSSYKFNIDCDKTYKIVAEKENYETTEFALTTDGKHDLETSKTLKLTPKECVQFLSGTILDSKTNLPIDQVAVSLFQDNRLVEKQTISKNSGYKFNIKCDKTYIIVAEKENYEIAELTLTTDGKYNVETSKTLKLMPVECIQLLSGTVVDGKTNLPIDQVIVSLFQNNTFIEKQTISKNSSYKFNIECDKTYKIVAEKENFETGEFAFTTDGKYNFETSKTLKLTPKECVQLLSGTILDSKTNLPIEQANVSLFQNNRLIEKQSISKNSSYKFNIECEKTYKIVAEKENYETAELTLTTDGKHDLERSKTLKLIPKECVQFLSGTILDSKTNLPMEQANVFLFQNNNLLEKQTISSNSSYKFNIECDKTYKIVAEKENYETAELTLKTDGKYNVETSKTLKLMPVECVQLLSATVVDSKTNLPMDQVAVSLFQNNRLVEKQTIAKNSGYKFNIKCDKTYIIVAEKENYEIAELTLTTDGKYNFETSKTLKLTPKECVQLLSGTVVDEETNLPLPNAMVTIYNRNELLERIKLDDNAVFTYKLVCGSQYRFKVSLKNYHDAISVVNTSDKRDEALNIVLAMESSIEFISVREQKMIKTKTINFDLNQSTIRLDAAIELNKVIAILRKYPKLKIEIKSHTDSRAPADYSLKLTNDRAKKVIDYIVANGIDKSRVSGRGYGETQLLNNCAKGVICTEAEHQMNRRTEFIITEE